MSGREQPWDLLVCRGCCCGSARKHRHTDHDAQLEVLRESGDDGSAVRMLVTDCLDRCEWSNVVVLRPPRAECKRGAKPIWLGRLLTGEQTEALAGWLRCGGPAAEPLPGPLQVLRMRPGTG